MPNYQYKVVPAPRKGVKARGVKGAEARFAHAIELRINDLAAQGWHYVRAETLPCDERAGLTNVSTTFRNVLVFRRPAEVQQAAPNTDSPAPVSTAPVIFETLVGRADITPDDDTETDDAPKP